MKRKWHAIKYIICAIILSSQVFIWHHSGWKQNIKRRMHLIFSFSIFFFLFFFFFTHLKQYSFPAVKKWLLLSLIKMTFNLPVLWHFICPAWAVNHYLVPALINCDDPDLSTEWRDWDFIGSNCRSSIVLETTWGGNINYTLSSISCCRGDKS